MVSVLTFKSLIHFKLNFVYGVVCCCCCLVAKLCMILCNPMDYSLPGSSDHGISQASILEGVAIPPPGDLPDPGVKPASPALAGRCFTAEPLGKLPATSYSSFENP